MKRFVYALGFGALLIGSDSAAQATAEPSADDASVCYGFRFGAWSPPLDWRAAGHPRRDSVPAIAMAPGGRDWAATLGRGAARDSVLLLFPEWWPAGVKIEVPRGETRDTIVGRAVALVAHAALPAPVSRVRAWRVSCTPGTGTALTMAQRLANVEREFLRLRDLRDDIDIAEARGVDTTVPGDTLDSVRSRYALAREFVVMSIGSVDTVALGVEDRRAVGAMRQALDVWLPAPGSGASDTSVAVRVRGCSPTAGDSVAAAGYDALSSWLYRCYGDAARRIIVDADTLDRLTVLELLRTTDDSAKRRRLFMGLEPVWRAVNGDNRPSSAYRRFIRMSAERWRRDGSPMSHSLAALGVSPDTAARWLTAMLEAWREAAPDSVLEPWDFYYAGGKASRLLRSALPLERLPVVNRRFYADIGADPVTLGVRYDLEPRAGKTPVAFTTFGRRAREGPPKWQLVRNEWKLQGTWSRTEPWVFATYRVGGLDNLGELLHETGHAIHIAAIRTRPAFLDWPDSDPWSEALGDLFALEVYEPRWQQRYLGRTVPIRDSFRAKYAGIVLDVAWSLFELRMHEDATADPNQVWADITSRYLRIAPHPEWSWWMIRGQLINSPGYMMNYAVGSVLIADLRAKLARDRGALACGDRGLYRYLSDRMYRFGLERPSGDVLAGVLGRRPTVDALLADMKRMQARAAGPLTCPPAGKR